MSLCYFMGYQEVDLRLTLYAKWEKEKKQKQFFFNLSNFPD